MRRAWIAALAVIATGGLAAWLLLAAPSPTNLVVVLACTQRRDQITPYGGPADTTPFLAELAADGARFADVVAASSWTKASAVAMFTGHHAISVGMIEPDKGQNRRILSDSVTTLAERLSASGYDTLGVTANPNLNRLFGMAQGFERYRDSASEGFALRNKIAGADVVTRALRMLGRRQDPQRPFYLRVVLIDPHKPMDPTPEELAAFGGRGTPKRVAEYRAMLRRADDAIRDLDAGLRQRGYTEDNTLFVVIADPGEGLSLPDHHRAQHGKVLYRTTTEVAWIARGPQVKRGHVIEGLASHVDFVPTVLALLGQEPDASLPGRDWSAQLRGAPRTDRERAWSETWYYGANRASVWTPTHQCQQDYGTTGVKDDTFVSGCFDRRNDPDFTETIEQAELSSALEDWRRDRLAEYDAWSDVRDADVDEAVQDQLEALGYVQGE